MSLFYTLIFKVYIKGFCSNLGVIWLQNTCPSDRLLCLGKMVKGRKQDAD